MVFEIIFFIIFAAALVIVIYGIVRGVSQWNRNNNSPRLSVVANVVAKRQHVSHHHQTNADGSMTMSDSTTYYVTFQVESGDRMELRVNRKDYGMIAEGDFGKLTFQGTRFIDFDRFYK